MCVLISHSLGLQGKLKAFLFCLLSSIVLVEGHTRGCGDSGVMQEGHPGL